MGREVGKHQVHVEVAWNGALMSFGLDGRPTAQLIPRETDRCKALCKTRDAVQRTFGRLKQEWALLPLRIRSIDRVTLHVDLTTLAQLASALADARAIPIGA